MSGPTTLDRRDAALAELAAPLGALLHTVNNALAVISTTTFALQIEQRLSDADADAILGGIEAARVAFASFEPIVSSRGAPETAVPGILPLELGSTVSAMVGRATQVQWQGAPPHVSDLTRATRRLLAAVWTATDELAATRVTVIPSVVNGCVSVSVTTPDGRVWGPVPIGVPV